MNDNSESRATNILQKVSEVMRHDFDIPGHVPFRPYLTSTDAPHRDPRSRRDDPYRWKTYQSVSDFAYKKQTQFTSLVDEIRGRYPALQVLFRSKLSDTLSFLKPIPWAFYIKPKNSFFNIETLIEVLEKIMEDVTGHFSGTVLVLISDHKQTNFVVVKLNFRDRDVQVVKKVTVIKAEGSSL